jgi:uncharacterized protein (DUF302 family)
VKETRYGLGIDVATGFDETVGRVTEALKAEGFGVLTTIDVKATLKLKLDRDFRRYVILGACNPHLASRALDAELELGLVLPCNVIVYERDDGRTAVSAMAPIPAMGMIGNDALKTVAAEADAHLRRALGTLESA